MTKTTIKELANNLSIKFPKKSVEEQQNAYETSLRKNSLLFQYFSKPLIMPKKTRQNFIKNWPTILIELKKLNYYAINKQIEIQKLTDKTLPEDINAFSSAVAILLKGQFDIAQRKNLNKIFNENIRLTPLAKFSESLASIELEKFTPSDAVTYANAGDQTKMQEIIKKALDNHSPATAGYGVQGLNGYTDNAIRIASTHLKKRKIGACQEFALLAVDQLRKKMEDKTIPTMTINIVTHDDHLGSHTFVVLGNPEVTKSGEISKENLKDCIIVDLWAYVMGENQTNGLFIVGNYPFSSMLTKVKLVQKFNVDAENTLDIKAATKKSSTAQLAATSSTASTLKTLNATTAATPTQVVTPVIAPVSAQARPAQKNTSITQNQSVAKNPNTTYGTNQNQEGLITVHNALDFIGQCYNTMSSGSKKGIKGELIRGIESRLSSIQQQNNSAESVFSKEVDNLALLAMDVFLTPRKGDNFRIEKNTPKGDVYYWPAEKSITKSGKQLLKLLQQEHSVLASIVGIKIDQQENKGFFEKLKEKLIDIFWGNKERSWYSDKPLGKVEALEQAPTPKRPGNA